MRADAAGCNRTSMPCPGPESPDWTCLSGGRILIGGPATQTEQKGSCPCGGRVLLHARKVSGSAGRSWSIGGGTTRAGPGLVKGSSGNSTATNRVT